MMRRRIAAALAAASVVTLGTAATAGAKWSKLDSVRDNFDTPEMVRLPDGTLHVAYNPMGRNGNDQRISVVNISAAGVPGAPAPIVTGWISAQQPAIIIAPFNHLSVFWHGCPVCTETDPLAGLDSSTSDHSGAAWSAPTRNDDRLVGDLAATVSAPSQTVYFAWDEGVNGLYTATSFGPAKHQLPNPDGVNENLASDPVTGQVYLGIVRVGRVITLQALDGTAAPLGPPINMPHLGGASPDDPVGRVAMVGRPGGGVYVADAFGYPSARFVGLWRVGGAVMQVADAGPFHDAIAGDAATADGRIWVFWRGANNHVFARRSNPAVTRFGAIVDAGEPGAISTFAPVGNATPSGGLDLVADATVGTSGGTALWYTRILPALTITEARQTLTAKPGKSVSDTFTVTDAGAPVAGAIVRVGSRTATTGAGGKATVTLPGQRRSVTLKPTASARNYFSAQIVLRIRVIKPRR